MTLCTRLWVRGIKTVATTPNAENTVQKYIVFIIIGRYIQ